MRSSARRPWFLLLVAAFAFVACLGSCGAAADCICPLIFDPVCDAKGILVAGNACEAACKELQEGSYNKAWCGGIRGSEPTGWVLPSKFIDYGFANPEYDGVVRNMYLNERYESLLEPTGELLQAIRKPVNFTPAKPTKASIPRIFECHLSCCV